MMLALLDNRQTATTNVGVVLFSVESDSLDCVFNHLLENPLLCERHHEFQEKGRKRNYVKFG
jgi:hypothetical protein